MQGAADRVGTDARKPVICLTQGGPQRGQRPCRRPITSPVRKTDNLGQDPPLLNCTVAQLLTTAVTRHKRGQPIAIEVRHPARNGITAAPADMPGGCRVALTFSHRQERPSPGYLSCRGTMRSTQPQQGCLLRITQPA